LGVVVCLPHAAAAATAAACQIQKFPYAGV
jgi:hypothetical protein